MRKWKVHGWDKWNPPLRRSGFATGLPGIPGTEGKQRRRPQACLGLRGMVRERFYDLTRAKGS